MDLSDPTRAITATLDGAVLTVLAVAGKPMTVGQVAQQAVRGSEIGIRRSLARLVEQGTVRATIMGRNQVHELNRDHVASSIAVLLAGLRTELWERFRIELSTWTPGPLYACVFGSAARGDGDVDSDIDLLLVHPPFPGEKKPARLSAGMKSVLADSAESVALASADPAATQRWEDQCDRLRERVESWTGNRLQIVDIAFQDWQRPPPQLRPLLGEVAKDGIEVSKVRGMSIWPPVDADG